VIITTVGTLWAPFGHPMGTPWHWASYGHSYRHPMGTLWHPMGTLMGTLMGTPMGTPWALL